MRKILMIAALFALFTQSANAGWWEQNKNESVGRFLKACTTLVDRADVEECQRRADLMRVPETATERDWQHSTNALVVFAQRFRAQFNMVIPPIGGKK